MSRHYDIVIVGGGPVGACTAALLATGGRRVALLDPRRPRDAAPEAPLDPRVVAISPGSRNVLLGAGAWNRLPAHRIQSYDQMAVHAGNSSMHFRASDHGMENLGWILEVPTLQEALWKGLESTGRVDCLTGQSLRSLEYRRGESRLVLDDDARVTTSLVVGADGGSSRVRRLAGIPVDTWHYNQAAVVSHLETTRRNPGIAWQRFTDRGPMALLPLPGGRSSLVWSQPVEQARTLIKSFDATFIEELERESGSPFGPILTTTRRFSFPLVRRQARRLTGPGLALVGDAGRTVHPLAGQGLNLGLMDAAALAEELQSWSPGEDPSGALQRYERWRKSSGTLVAEGIHQINELFSNRLPGMGRLGGLGMALAGRAWPLRDLFARRAAGLDGDSPLLARTPPARGE